LAHKRKEGSCPKGGMKVCVFGHGKYNLKFNRCEAKLRNYKIVTGPVCATRKGVLKMNMSNVSL
jgi:hypothetical protein